MRAFIAKAAFAFATSLAIFYMFHSSNSYSQIVSTEKNVDYKNEYGNCNLLVKFDQTQIIAGSTCFDANNNISLDDSYGADPSTVFVADWTIKGVVISCKTTNYNCIDEYRQTAGGPIYHSTKSFLWIKISPP